MTCASLPRLAAVGLTALLLVGTACGDSDDASDDAASTTAAPTTAANAIEPSDGTAATETTAAETEDETTTTDGGSGADEPADACSLLTADDASEALGEEVVPGFTQEADLCIWSDAADLRTVQLAILDEDPDEWRAARQAGEFEPVDDVGDEAYYGPVFEDLSFLVGDQVYEVDVELRGDGDGLEVATSVAEAIISRL